MDHDVYCGAANPPDRVPALFARFLVDPVFFQDPAFIGKNAGGERKGDAVLLLIQAVLSFVPFQPHVYIVYIYSGCRSKCKSNRGGRQMPTESGLTKELVPSEQAVEACVHGHVREVSPFEGAFHPPFPAVSQEILKPARTATRCTSMLASSSHTVGVGELGRDLQNLG